MGKKDPTSTLRPVKGKRNVKRSNKPDAGSRAELRSALPVGRKRTWM